MSERTDEKSLYWAIVGPDRNTNEGLARLLGLIILLIVAGGVIAWIIGR
ncbi:hypothetical protein ACI2J4_10285 [Agrobacterium tumefaciens]